MIERHQDYQLTIATVPPGGLIDIPLRLDSDAPFRLRLVKSRNLGVSGFQFKTPRDQYQSSGYRTDLIYQAPGATLPNPQPSRGCIIYPELSYPIGATIPVSVGNNTGSNLTNVKVLFRGSKLYPDGAVSSATYPRKMSVLPFAYPVLFGPVPAVCGFGNIPGPRNIELRIDSDADFAMRYGACDPYTMGQDGGEFNPFNYDELYITLRDEFYKAYSNEPIHVNDLLGQGQPALYQQAGVNDDSIVFLPGLFTPEIYIPRDHSIYFDLARNDAGGGPVNLHFRFQGSKVFQR